MTKRNKGFEDGDLIEAIIPSEIANVKLADISLLNDYRLRDNRKLWLDFEVDVDVLDLERQILLWNMQDVEINAVDREPIWLYLFNYGGDSNLEQSLIDVIDASITPVHTVNMGVCASAAAEIFVAGRCRYMMKNARVMFHQGFGAISGDAQKMRDNIEDYSRQLEKAKEFLLARTKIPPEEYESHKYNDWWLSAEECLKYGVCDQIIQSLDEVI